MKIKFLIAILVSLVVISVFVLAAKPDFQAATIKNPVTEEPKNTVTIPAKAVEVAPNIFYLGASIDKGKVVEGYAFIDYKKGFVTPTCDNDGVCEPGEKKSCVDCRNGGGEPDTSSCYGFLARGAKWKTVEDYMVDPSNTEGLNETFVRTNLAADIDKWETAAGVNILRNEII